mgnify:CR=1 FL=1
MKRINLFVILIGIFILNSYAYSSQDFYFSNLNLKDGLSQISVLDILQDSKGYMWFATRNGLNRYDGKNFVIYKNDPTDSLSLSNNHIYCLAEDSHQNLWIGTFHGLNVLNMKTNQLKRVVDSPYRSVKEMAIIVCWSIPVIACGLEQVRGCIFVIWEQVVITFPSR